METTQVTRVYIVEDSSAIRARLSEMLSRMESVSVVGEADCAREAVCGILRARPDSVLLDLNLMGRTGFDVMKTVRPKAPEIVFVVLTNHAEPQYRRAATEAGAAYFLDKSREFDRVPQVIAEIAAARPTRH
ncbi:MAG TPA: response regulator [Usitatibacter sp.]|nr:response regulator [Usitatibacter sp.]